MQILIKNKAIDNFLQEIADAFLELAPGIHANFLAYARQHNAGFVKPSGMSADGNFLCRFYIPSFLYTFIKKQAKIRLGIDDFFSDSKRYYRLMKIWADCNPRKPKRPFYDGGAIKCQNRNDQKESPSASSPRIVLPT